MYEYTQELDLVENENALSIINKISELLGGSANEEKPDHSSLLSLLNRGIVIHHGSLPLQARFLIEEFIDKGFCRLCFATSTLYQGINMPFDIVYLKRLEESRPLLVKNLIGRAGRSTTKPIFDYGQVIVGYGGMSTIRNILARNEVMSRVSQIDIDNEDDDADLSEFKHAIRNGELDDFYNLTKPQIDRLNSSDVSDSIEKIMNILLPNDDSIEEVYKNLSPQEKSLVTHYFQHIYKQHVKNRELSPGEEAVIETAVRIFMLQIGGRNLRSIIEARFAYIAQTSYRKNLEGFRLREPLLYAREIERLEPKPTMPAEDLPNKDLLWRGLFMKGTKIHQAGYDQVMYDTYDYIDKVWGFGLSDVFYAAFDLYFKNTSEAKAQAMCKYIRYATIDDNEIWLLRYGFSFEEIEWIMPLVQSVDERRIKFNDVSRLDQDQIAIIERYLPPDR